MLTVIPRIVVYFFFFNDTATTEIYTLSLHDALPILAGRRGARRGLSARAVPADHEVLAPVDGEPGPRMIRSPDHHSAARSEEHTSELQSRQYLVCRLLLEKKKKIIPSKNTSP